MRNPGDEEREIIKRLVPAGVLAVLARRVCAPSRIRLMSETFRESDGCIDEQAQRPGALNREIFKMS